jgi:hypothetical protein
VIWGQVFTFDISLVTAQVVRFTVQRFTVVKFMLDWFNPWAWPGIGLEL